MGRQVRRGRGVTIWDIILLGNFEKWKSSDDGAVLPETILFAWFYFISSYHFNVPKKTANYNFEPKLQNLLLYTCRILILRKNAWHLE